jgi:hypothetical protein
MAEKRGQGLSAAKAARLLDGYSRSGQTRRDYCRHLGIPVSTLDYYRRRQSQQRGQELIPVTVVAPASGAGFTLVLNNGRRIESHWDFREGDLARLVQVAEQA